MAISNSSNIEIDDDSFVLNDQSKMEYHQGSSCRFFVIGDPGKEGPARKFVGEALGKLQHHWITEEQECPASFSISTGDNIYSQPNDLAFDRFAADFLNHVPVPWLIALGNHDVSPEKLRWHLSRHGQTGPGAQQDAVAAEPASSETPAPLSQWRWICPAVAFAGRDHLSPSECPPDLLEIFVINTNKLNKAFARPASGPAPDFYTAKDKRWWNQQKQSLAAKLSQSPARWKIVIGHHPCEFVPVSWLEHKTPVVKYFAATFMKGGKRSRAARQGLSHIIGRHADLYLCGHQHLMACLSLDPTTGLIPSDECRCQYGIVGASSQLDEDPIDLSLSDSPLLTPETLVPSDSEPRYLKKFIAPPVNGFFVIDVNHHELIIRCFVMKDQEAIELYQHLIQKEK